MLMPYINGELTDSELESFLLHIRDCKDCQEELEITFTIHQGLRQLDDKTEDDDMAKALEDSINDSWLRVRSMRLLDMVSYIIDTLCAAGVIVTLIMQIAVWIR